jgi:HEAT repeat protein
MSDVEKKRETLLPTLLRLIGVSDRALSARELRAFSGLESGDRSFFWPTWQTIGDERRAEIAHSMVEMAEDVVELDFNELWFWLLDDHQPAVRVAAVEGLWENESPRALRRMLGLLQDDPAPEVRAAAAMGLSRFAYQASLGELADGSSLERGLLDAVRDGEQPIEVRRRALESAGYFAESDDVQQQVEMAYGSKEQLLRESAIVAMGRSMLPRWLPVIGKELSNSSPALRYEAAHAAAEMGEDARSLLPKLLPLLDDDDSEVSLEAIWALGQIGGQAAKRALERISRSNDEAHSQAAEEALAELGLDNLDV